MGGYTQVDMAAMVCVWLELVDAGRMDLDSIDVQCRSSVNERCNDFTVMPFSYLVMLVFLDAINAKLTLSFASCGS